MKTYIFFIFSSMLLLSCASKRDLTDKYLQKNPKYLAQICAINFPAKIKFIEGKTNTDTIIKTVPGKKIPCPEYIDENGNLNKPSVQCPDQKIKEIITVRTDTVYLENTANVSRLQQENFELTSENKTLMQDKENLEGIIFRYKIVFVLLAIILYLIFRRK